MKYTIIGAGKSGLSAALLAKKKGNSVFLSESNSIEKYKDEVEILKSNGIDYEFGVNSEKALEFADVIITSPGVPPKAFIIQEAEKRNIKIISELEFASQFLKNPTIAITGTNGKTTTTTLIEYILNNSGRKATGCGNIGKPVSDLVDNVSEDTILVIETSSFQLDRIDKYRPNVAIIMNITPDHLYYHGTMEEYKKAKFKIFSNQIEKDLLILNCDDEQTLEAKALARGQVVCFSINPMQQGIYCSNNNLAIRFPNLHKEEKIMLINELSLPGIHNRYNAMAAALATRAFEVKNENIRDSLMKFQGVEHRLEFVRKINGISFVNDSKATNINAAWYALSSYDAPIVWIAGGRADLNDYSALDDLVKQRVKSIICIGEEQNNIFNHYCTITSCKRELTFDDAVKSAYSEAEAGDIVLFAPACKSFDMFLNFEHRGEVFKELVMQL